MAGLVVIERTRIAMAMWMVVICWVSYTLPQVQAIWINLPSSGTKCVSEEIQNHVVVIADYAIVFDEDHHSADHAANITVSAKVTSPYGVNLHHIENVTHGQFAFTTTEAGNYVACFWVDGNLQTREGPSLSLDWRTGIATKDWETVAKKDKIEGVELELAKLEGLVEAIHENLNYLKDRESEMREVSEVTNARVAWFSIMSLGTCILVSVWQLWYLKRYFHKKKLI